MQHEQEQQQQQPDQDMWIKIEWKKRKIIILQKYCRICMGTM